MRILGIDCGSRVTGYGVIEAGRRSRRAVTFGAIRVSAERDMARRLRRIADGLDEVIERYQPEEAAIEDVFVKGNVRSAMVLAQVRGAAMLVASRAGLGVSSYSPAQVKGSVVGYGTASKEQVRQMVQALLSLRAPVKPLDASDALAVAFCHANLRDWARRGGQA